MYQIVARLGEELVATEHEKYGRQTWALGNKPTLKDHICSLCNKVIKKGEWAFSPLSNKRNRGDRLHRECVSKAEERKYGISRLLG